MTIDQLTNVADEVDFAVCLFAADDDMYAGEGVSPRAAPRDNVVLEAGLFIQALGRERCMILSQHGVKIPTDLDGVTRIMYSHDAPGLAKATKTISSHVIRQGTRSAIVARGDGDMTIIGTNLRGSKVVNRAGSISVVNSDITRSVMVNDRPNGTLSIASSVIASSDLANAPKSPQRS